ncbi:MAG TPA: tetratricopeptide repeat protein [Verrucomicrobiae bacterium]|nr:tetratricopeptide repeat protein [Verrucomicrobiae bacterium]
MVALENVLGTNLKSWMGECPSRPIRRNGFQNALQFFIALLLCCAAAGCNREEKRATDPSQPAFAFAGSASCRECHRDTFEQWHGSHHQLAERPIDPQLDSRAFEPERRFQHGSQSVRVFLSNNVPWIEAIGLSGKPEVHAVARVLGHDPLRQFLVEFPGGRLQAMEAAYDPHSNNWFNVFGNEDRQPGEWGHWTGRGLNWNSMCASCHNTGLQRNYSAASDSYHTRFLENGVGCESCHGSMQPHNDWQKQFGKSGRPDPSLSKLTRVQTQDYCGSCHSRRSDLTGQFKAGEAFLDHYSPALVDASETYYADGQVRDEDFEFGSFLGSRMHAKGVTCIDCHNPHTAKTILPGNFLCIRCHDGSRSDAPKIDPVSHSRHKVFGYSTEGAMTNFNLAAYDPATIKEKGGECVNCHMPQTTYMQRHRRHDHGFTIPDPLLTRELGIPNACTRCHQDKDVEWAIHHSSDWYGERLNRPTRRRARLIAQAQQLDPQAAPQLLAWLPKEPLPYWQAVIAGLLEPWAGDGNVSATLKSLLQHTNALVRASAARALEPAVHARNAEVVTALRQALKDSQRNVRVAAAWSLRAERKPGSRADQELRASLEVGADQPLGQMQLGNYFIARGDLQTAVSHFQKAVQWDQRSPAIRQQLAILLSQLGRPHEAVEQLQAACRLAPSDANYRYELGLAHNEIGDLSGAVRELSAAVKLDPRLAMGWYNLGLAQHAMGQSVLGLESLAHAERLEPAQARIPYARATILLQIGQRNEAFAAARRALQIDPSHAESRALLQLQ